MQKFERYEFKYVIPKFICHELEKNLINFMELDNFSKQNKLACAETPVGTEL